MRTNVSLIKADTEEGFGVGVTRGRHIHQSPQGLASPLFFFSPHFSGGSAGKAITEKIEELGEAGQGQKQGLNASRTSEKEDFRRQVGKSGHGKWVQSADWVTES